MQIKRAIIEAAIVGFERQKEQIDETIAELRAQLDGGKNGRRTAEDVASPDGAKRKRRMSAAGRKRIAEAQRKRWAEIHAKQKR